MATLDKKLVLEELQEEELDQATGGRGRGGDGTSTRTPEEIVRTQ